MKSYAGISCLWTDASDYGYGVYLCQIIDKCGYPAVLFLSRSFQKSELNRNAQDNKYLSHLQGAEKFQFLLYNRMLVLLGRDSKKNLAFLNNAPLSRVYRWKLVTQQ